MSSLFDPAVTAPVVERFGSGCSAHWDMRGYMLVGVPLGVTAIELSRDLIPLLCRYADNGGRILVDSGAIRAFRQGRTLDFEREVFPVYEALIDGTRHRAGLVLVAPDVIGDEHATASLQVLYRQRILRWLASGAECLFPIQNPAGDHVAQAHRVDALVGRGRWIAGVPSNEAAWAHRQVVAFAQAVQPLRLHLLGLSREDRVDEIAAAVAACSPRTRISCDACLLLAHVGKGRRLTDRCASRMAEAVDAAAQGAFDGEPAWPVAPLSSHMVDLWHEPGFVSEDLAVALASALGFVGERWARKFAQASHGALGELLGHLDPHDEWIEDAARSFVLERLYRPAVQRALAGPIRAWELARLACGDDPDWHLVQQRPRASTATSVLGRRARRAVLIEALAATLANASKGSR
jgi:hypothetical protein